MKRPKRTEEERRAIRRETDRRNMAKFRERHISAHVAQAHGGDAVGGVEEACGRASGGVKKRARAFADPGSHSLLGETSKNANVSKTERLLTQASIFNSLGQV